MDGTDLLKPTRLNAPIITRKPYIEYCMYIINNELETEKGKGKKLINGEIDFSIVFLESSESQSH